MSDLEFFNPSEGGESYDPAAFERFKEQIKKNAAAMAAQRKSEQKQKQKEDRLAKLLLKFIQTNQKQGILLLAARLLQENIPASFILSIIVLGNEALEEELKKEEAAFAQEQAALPEAKREADGPPSPKPTEFSLIVPFSDHAMPLRLKAQIDDWGKGMFEAASGTPFRVIETVTDKEGNYKKIVIDCAANVLQDFFTGNNYGGSLTYDTFFSFCEFLMKAILKQLKTQIENQKEIR